MSDDPYKSLKERLKLKANKISRIIGIANYDTEQAEKDFVEYFNKFKSEKILAFNFLGSFENIVCYENANYRSSDSSKLPQSYIIHNYVKFMDNSAGGITGSCNPYSPIILASSELAGGSPWEL